MNFKVEIRQNCKVCGKPITEHKFRTFCSKKCRDKFYQQKYQPYRSEWQRNRADIKSAQPNPDKVKCLICGRYYVQVGTHVVERHGYSSARKYREDYELEVKRGTVPDWYRKEKGEMALANKTFKNLEAGAKYRFKKGDDTNYHRSPITLNRVAELGRNQLNKKKGDLTPLTIANMKKMKKTTFKPGLDRKNKPTSMEEALFVVHNWDTMSIEELASEMGRPVNTVVAIYKGLKKSGLRLAPKTATQGGRKDFFDSIVAQVAKEKGFSK